MPAKQENVLYSMQPFRRAVLRGLGVVLPPLLTFVILLWIANSIQTFVLNPVEWSSQRAMVWFMNETMTEVPVGADLEPDATVDEGSTQLSDSDSTTSAATEKPRSVEPRADQPGADAESDADASTRSTRPDSTNEAAAEARRSVAQPGPAPSDDVAPAAETDRLLAAIERLETRLDGVTGNLPVEASLDVKQTGEPMFLFENKVFVQLENGDWIPEHIRNAVNTHVLATGIPLQNSTGKGYYDHYVEHQVLKKILVIPVFLAGFILLMYLLGRFLAAGVGRILWSSMEAVINQLPIIRTVYSSVKQVTDFFVGESDIEFKRVVAVEYPRRGVWSVGFVTGESMLTLRGAVDGEPIVSILMPTSPVPGTGFTITVRKDETIDLDIPIDQALQFVVSCGVVIPDNEIQHQISSQIRAASADPQLQSNAVAVEQE